MNLKIYTWPEDFMGKGSNIRPRFIPDSEWRENFDRIFGNPDEFDEGPPETSGQYPVSEGDDTENEMVGGSVPYGDDRYMTAISVRHKPKI